MDNQILLQSENFNTNPVYGLNEAQLDIQGQRRWKAHQTICGKLKSRWVLVRRGAFLRSMHT